MSTKTCTKVKYPGQAAAVRAASAARRSGNTYMNAYQCKTCKDESGARAWHIGRSLPRTNWLPGKRKRRQN